MAGDQFAQKPSPNEAEGKPLARAQGRHNRSRESRWAVPTPLKLRDWMGNFRSGSVSLLDEAQPPPTSLSILLWLLSLLGIGFSRHGKQSASSAHRLRTLIEGLGGLWVPFAHLLSRQTVRFSTEFCEEMKQTRYPTVNIGYNAARSIIEGDLNAPLKQV